MTALAHAEELRVTFGGITALDGVDISIGAREIVGLVGANGAGKSTLLDCLSGHIRPRRQRGRLRGRLDTAAGRVYLGDAEITGRPPDTRARRGIVRSFQDARLFPTMPVWDTLLLAQERALRSRTPASLLGLPSWLAGERRRAAAAVELAERMGLERHLGKLVGELSTGERRVLDLACAIALGPRLLLLDEPSAGLSSAEASELGPVLRGVRDSTGAGMVMVEHDLPLVWGLADRIVVLEQGRVAAVGRPDELRQHPSVSFGRLG